MISNRLFCPMLLRAQGSVRMPGSKSISNRVLLLAALAEGTTTIRYLLHSDDTDRMRQALIALGVPVVLEQEAGNSLLRVDGCGGRFLPQAELFMGNAGTAMRTLAAVLACLNGQYRLYGVARMHQRPIADLVDALRQVGAEITYEENTGCPPIRIAPRRQLAEQELHVRIRGDVSSQFLSGLLIALPLLQRDVHIHLISRLISRPYVDMTCKMMQMFGVTVEQRSPTEFFIKAGSHYQSPQVFDVEGDASSASYFLAAGAISAALAPTTELTEHAKHSDPEHTDAQANFAANIASNTQGVTVLGLGSASIQGDVAFAEALRQMGADVEIAAQSISVHSKRRTALSGQTIDCIDIPDAAMTLAVVALFASGSTTLTGIGSWRVKETDRIAAMATELRKFGAAVIAGDDYLTITPPECVRTPHQGIDTYDDHRIAMCFSLAAFATPLYINDPAVVNKTFPDYFAQLATITQPIPVIAIDGPSASGKGTVAALLAAKLGFHYLDSGALYRLTALAAKQQNVDWQDESVVAAIATALDFRFEQHKVYLAGAEVSLALRENSISQGASVVASHPAVRVALLDSQRFARRAPGLVADGRDMAHVFPDAVLKIYLDASAVVRAERRYKQLIEYGKSVTLTALIEEMQQRDARDRLRAVAPLTVAESAVVVDTSSSTIAQVVEKIEQLAQTALIRCR